jgi:hypothetical protein
MRWLLLLPIDLLATPWCWLTAPIVVLFSDGSGWLTRRLWWYQTPDNSLDGDNGWRTEHFVGWPRYIKRVLWLWRNPMYGLAWDGPLAAKIKVGDLVATAGDPWIKNRQNAIAGSYFCTVGDHWNYKLVQPLYGDTALMLEFGWKLQEFAQGRAESGRAMYVASVRLTAFYPSRNPSLPH